MAINTKCKAMVQKQRSFNLEKSAAIKREMAKLLAVESIWEAKYLEWVANMVPVKKKNNQ